jgi:hypothetical protein
LVGGKLLRPTDTLRRVSTWERRERAGWGWGGGGGRGGVEGESVVEEKTREGEWCVEEERGERREERGD